MLYCTLPNECVKLDVRIIFYYPFLFLFVSCMSVYSSCLQFGYFDWMEGLWFISVWDEM